MSSRGLLLLFLHRLAVRTQAMFAGQRSTWPCHHANDEVTHNLSARDMYEIPTPEEVASKMCTSLCLNALFAFFKDAIVQAQKAACIGIAGSFRPMHSREILSSRGSGCSPACFTHIPWPGQPNRGCQEFLPLHGNRKLMVHRGQSAVIKAARDGRLNSCSQLGT